MRYRALLRPHGRKSSAESPAESAHGGRRRRQSAAPFRQRVARFQLAEQLADLAVNLPRLANDQHRVLDHDRGENDSQPATGLPFAPKEFRAFFIREPYNETARWPDPPFRRAMSGRSVEPT